MSVGDINSNEAGTAARYNDDKIPTQYLPLYALTDSRLAHNTFSPREMMVLNTVAGFETRYPEINSEDMLNNLVVSDYQAAAGVLEYGATKYKEWNWARGQKVSVALASLKRHVMQIMDGETIDSESGCLHWGHVICNLLFVYHFMCFHPNMDDRPPEVCFGQAES